MKIEVSIGENKGKSETLSPIFARTVHQLLWGQLYYQGEPWHITNIQRSICSESEFFAKYGTVHGHYEHDFDPVSNHFAWEKIQERKSAADTSVFSIWIFY